MMFLFHALISEVHQQFNRKHNGDNNLAEKATVSIVFAQKATFKE